MLNQVLQEIKSAQSALKLSDLSHKLGVERSALDGMIQFLVRKGRLRNDDEDLAAVTTICSPPSCGPLSLKFPKLTQSPTKRVIDRCL